MLERRSNGLTRVVTARKRIIATLALWRERARQRQELSALPPHLLFDIGVRPDDAIREARRRPWEPPGRWIKPLSQAQTRSYRMLRINDEAPNFRAETTKGTINFHDWIGSDWVVLFSHPKDFTPVCTTEIGAMAKSQAEFDRRGCKLIGLSVDTVADHERWIRDIEATQGHRVDFPLIADTRLAIAKLYGMLPADAGDDSAGRTLADNATVRSTFVIGPDKRIKLMFTYPMSTGRNTAELLRAIDSLQLTTRHKLATPVNWQSGDDVIIVPAVSDEEARKKFPKGWASPTPYMRIVAQPLD